MRHSLFHFVRQNDPIPKCEESLVLSVVVRFLKSHSWVLPHSQPARQVQILVFLDLLPFELEEEPSLAEREPLKDVEDLKWDVEVLRRVGDDHVGVLVAAHQVQVLVSPDSALDAEEEVLAAGLEESILELVGGREGLVLDLAFTALMWSRFSKPDDVLGTPKAPLLEQLSTHLETLNLLAAPKDDEGGSLG